MLSSVLDRTQWDMSMCEHHLRVRGPVVGKSVIRTSLSQGMTAAISFLFRSLDSPSRVCNHAFVFCCVTKAGCA